MLKWRTFELTGFFNYWETVEDRPIDGRGVHAAMRLICIESSFYPCKFSAIVPGAYPGEAKMRRKCAKADCRN